MPERKRLINEKLKREKRKKNRTIYFFLLFLLISNQVYSINIKSIQPITSTNIGIYEKFELETIVSNMNCHKDDLQIIGNFIRPDGMTNKIGGFAYNGSFRMRYTPMDTGNYSYYIKVDDGINNDTSGIKFFKSSSVTSKPDGFLRIIEKKIRFNSNKYFYILGDNRMNIYRNDWNYNNMSSSEYINYLSKNGINTIRVFIFTDMEDEYNPTQAGCIEKSIGRYDEDEALKFDEIINSCKSNNVYVILCLYAMGFTPDFDFADWYDNPFYVDRGGPCNDRAEFFNWNTMTVRTQQKRKLNYLINRWGYSTHLLAIDIFNEPDYDGPNNESLYIPWCTNILKYAKENDPYNHILTVGPVGDRYYRDKSEEELYEFQYNEMVQWHHYGEHNYQKVAYQIRDEILKWGKIGKPVFCGEGGWGNESKPEYDHTHNIIWSAVLSGGGMIVHSAPPFTPETDEHMTPERIKHFKILSDFLKNVPLENLQFSSNYTCSLKDKFSIMSLRKEDYIIMWILDKSSTYGNNISGAAIEISGLIKGKYKVEWVNDTNGEKKEIELCNTGNSLKLLIPDFSKHIALKIYKIDENCFNNEIYKNYMFYIDKNPVKIGEICKLCFTLSSDGMVTINVYSLKGELVYNLYGNTFCYKNILYTIRWDGKKDKCKKVLPGIYFVYFKFDNYKPLLKTIGLVN